MEVTEDVVARIPPGNLRVPRAKFATIWATAERLNREACEQRVVAWYPAGVAVACRWLAGAVVEDQFGRRPAQSPVTNRSENAYEELIEAEYLAAELLPIRRPGLARRQPGWSEGVLATLRWAWRREGPPPLALDADVASVVPVPRTGDQTPRPAAPAPGAAAVWRGYAVPRS
ncbi:hypothetical protein [Pseudonocardia sp.]|uniref:hypothetical protein n=1 Tax=Pseudonocardia sp. TaxID=60912 RepID=UPI003D0BCD08